MTAHRRHFKTYVAAACSVCGQSCQQEQSHHTKGHRAYCSQECRKVGDAERKAANRKNAGTAQCPECHTVRKISSMVMHAGRLHCSACAVVAPVEQKLYPCRWPGCSTMSTNRMYCQHHHTTISRRYREDCEPA